MRGLAALAIASWCSGLRSDPSRVFSGAPILIHASHSSSSFTRSGDRSATSSAGAVSAQTVSKGQKSIPEKLSWTIGTAFRRPIALTTSSTSGLACALPMTSTSQPGCTSTHRSTRSVA